MADNSKPELSPMMKQYMEIKERNPEHILFYRMGDFFELFFEDAVVASKVLNLTLTTRGKHLNSEIPLAGFPHTQLNNYLAKMIKAGYRIVVCDQVEDPKTAKGIVKRDIVEIVTAGTALTDNIIEPDSNNYLAAIHYQGGSYGLAVCEVSTGDFFAASFSDLKEFTEAILYFHPSEILYPADQPFFDEKAAKKYSFNLTKIDGWKFDFEYCSDLLKDYYRQTILKLPGFEKDNRAVSCIGVLLNYIKENFKSGFSHIGLPKRYQPQDFVGIDENTRRNLELLEPLSYGGNHKATLYAVLNFTKTAMGARMLKSWLTAPLLNEEKIQTRLDAVEALANDGELRKNLISCLKSIADIERLTAKISTHKVVPVELLKLKESLKQIPVMIELFTNSEVLQKITSNFYDMNDCLNLIESTISDDAPLNVNEGNFIKSGYSSELDELRSVLDSGKNWVLDLQAKVREELNIPSMKVGYNRVFGYYFEVTKRFADQIPAGYTKKQTLTNADRFINEELKVLEDKILNADEKISELEKNILALIREECCNFVAHLKKNSEIIAYIDCLTSFAEAAVKNNYCRPVLVDRFELEIHNGRHPVVEKLLPPGEDFIPNNLRFNEKEQILIITGPNMSGKSTYLRQAALIALMAQAGSFVPAERAVIGLVDKIFTRVGASDNLAGGESTFLVEMNESANILQNATRRSLIILDEVGRGTSTFDGLSLAWSIVEYIHNHRQLMARTLFATHYHELIEIDKICKRVKNYSVSVKEYNNEVVFMRKIVEGGADDSYGIYVAKLAGLPVEVIERAKEILANLESNELTPDRKPKIAAGKKGGAMIEQPSLFSFQYDALRETLESVNVNNLTPMEALLMLEKLKKMI